MVHRMTYESAKPVLNNKNVEITPCIYRSIFISTYKYVYAGVHKHP